MFVLGVGGVLVGVAIWCICGEIGLFACMLFVCADMDCRLFGGVGGYCFRSLWFDDCFGCVIWCSFWLLIDFWFDYDWLFVFRDFVLGLYGVAYSFTLFVSFWLVLGFPWICLYIDCLSLNVILVYYVVCLDCSSLRVWVW